MEDESPTFGEAIPIAKCMVAFSALCYVVDLIGVNYVLFSVLLGLISLGVGLYLGYLVTQAIKETEIRYNSFLNSRSVHNAWMVMAITDAVAFVAAYVFTIVALATVICSFVAGICFLIQLNRSANFYINFKGGNNGTF